MNPAQHPASGLSDITRHDWSLPEIEALFALSFNELLFRAHSVHRQHFDPDEIQISRLLSIKTGAVPKIAPIAHKVLITIPAWVGTP